MLIASIILSIAVAPAQVRGSVPATFYNMAGATPAALAQELDRCRAIATQSMAGTAIAPGALADTRVPPVATDALQDCMLARGWRLFTLGAAERLQIERLRPAARDRLLAELTGADRPSRGRLLRSDTRSLLRVPAGGPTPAATPPAPSTYDRAIAAGYKASFYCSAIFNAGRAEADIDRVELRGIYSEYDAIVPTLKATVDRARAFVTVEYDDGPGASPRMAEWNPGTGCTTRPIHSPARTGMLYRDPLPAVPGPAGADARAWPVGDAAVAPAPRAALAGAVARAFDRQSFGAGSETTGVVVVHRGRIVAERYADGFGPFVSNRTWSVAKSLAGAVIGHAQHRGILDVTQPAYVPEWGCCPGPGEVSPDPRTLISNDDLLRMTSGLHSDTAGNRTDALYFGGATVTGQAGSWPSIALPGSRYRYANNDTVLAVRSLRAHLDDDAAYARFPADLFAKLGMRHTVAEADWEGNFILSSQIWSTARDLARFGLFMAADGVWNGERLLPEGWMRDSLRPVGAQPASGPGYGRTLWLFGPEQGLPAGSYAAQGNRGQYVMVIPSRQLVIVRRGEDPGRARFDIAKFAADVAVAL